MLSSGFGGSRLSTRFSGLFFSDLTHRIFRQVSEHVVFDGWCTDVFFVSAQWVQLQEKTLPQLPLEEQQVLR